MPTPPTFLASAREILFGTARVRHEHLQFGRASITGIIALLLAGICVYLDQDAWAVPLVLGATFTGVLNLNGDPHERLWSMAWSLLWLSGATLLGGLISPWRWTELGVVALVGFIAGYAGTLGSRSAVMGVLALVLFTVYSGTDVTPEQALTNAGFLAVGSLLHLVIILISELIRTPRRLLRQTARPHSGQKGLIRDGYLDQSFFHHAARLAVALVLGSLIARYLAWPHPYWIPMTIVWMSKPDQTGTFSRVIERIFGTLLGLGIAILLIEWVSDNSWAISIYMGLGVFLALAFLQANYPIAVAGITLIVIALFSLLGEPVGETAHYRAAATVAAGVITALVALFWRNSLNDRAR